MEGLVGELRVESQRLAAWPGSVPGFRPREALNFLYIFLQRKLNPLTGQGVSRQEQLQEAVRSLETQLESARGDRMRSALVHGSGPLT